MSSARSPSYEDFRSLRFSAGGHPLTRLLSQRVGARLGWLALRADLSPSAVTWLGLGVFVTAAILYATLPPGWAPALLCLVLLQLGYALDCADGQLARATDRVTADGTRLDLACDYARNAALAAAVTAWLARSGIDLATAVAVGAVLLAGTAGQLRIVTLLRRHGARPRPPTPGRAGYARTLATALIDTPTVLAGFAALRLAPTLLAAYAVTIGFGYAAMMVAVLRAHRASVQS